MKIKILIITYTHSNGGGAENVLTTFVNNLDQYKYEVTIQEVDFFGVKKEKINKNVHVKKIPLNNATRKDIFALINRYYLFHNPSVLKSVFNWNGFDIVLAWNYQWPSFALNAFTKEFKISHFHGAVNDLDINKFPDQKQNFERQLQAWNFADRITTISNKSKESLLFICPQFSDKISFIHNGADIDNVLAKSRLEEEKKIEYGKDSIKLISIGRLDQNKNISLVLKALSILKRKDFNIEYLILGTGELQNKLYQEVQELGVGGSVHFLGYIQNPYPYLKKADILCMSSFSEGWPTVVVEAMILSKPFVTTKVPGASEELCNNETCGLVSDWTPEMYAEQLEKLCKDKELRDKLGENGNLLIQNYSTEASQREFENLICGVELKKKEIKSRKKGNFKINYIICFATGIISLKERFKNFKLKRNLFGFFKVCVTTIEIPLLFLPKIILGIVYCFEAEK